MSVVYKIQILRGNFVNLPLLQPGELAFCLDSHQLYAGDGIVNTLIGEARVSDGDKGDITVSSAGDVWTIDARTIDAGKLEAVSSGKILSRLTAGAGDVEQRTLSELLDSAYSPGARAMLYRGATDWASTNSPSDAYQLQGVMTGGTAIPTWVAKGKALVEDVKTAGTNGGTFTAGAWQTRTLNTITYDTLGRVSLSSNQITLPAGTYLIRASAPASVVQSHQIRLEDSLGTVLAVGSSEFVNATASTRSHLSQLLIFASSTTIVLKHRAQVTDATFGFGVAANFGSPEHYAVVEIDVLA